MKTRNIAMLVGASLLITSFAAVGYVINNWWPDGDNIVMDDVLSPAATWSSPAQFQMSEYNEIDTTDNSHPFRINNNPQFSFGANDGDNTIGFLGEAGLNSEYGLSYASALAWAVTWTGFFSGRIDECDVMLDPTLPWNLDPDDDEWFQSTVLHELGHCRGLGHYNNYLSMQNSGTSKYLRAETLYMDDKVAIRQNASTVSERDIVMYNKWHNGSTPQWMTMSPTTLREGQTVNLNNITVENRGSLSFGSPVSFGIYLSTNDFISTADQLLNTGTYGSFGTFTFNTFNWSAQMPSMNDCSTRYIGGIIDYNNAWAERFENNNNVTFTNGVPYTGETFSPTPLTILLAEDGLEPNDSLGGARSISLPFSSSNLNIDQDSENDYYRVVVPSSGTFAISVTFTHSLGNINLRLLNSAGTTLASSLSTTNNESINYQVPAGGTYYIRVYGNGSGSCNKYSLTASFTPPDLITINPGVSDTTLFTGQNFTASATVQNQGGGTSASTTLRYYRSTNSIISTLDTQIATDAVAGLAPGGTSPESAVVAAPATPGTYWIGACVDAVAGESPTNNQCSSGVQITVATPPDLITISPAVSNSTPNPGQVFTASATVQNQGGSTAASTTLRYYESTNSTISTADTQIATDAVASLAPGGTSPESASVAAPATPGTYWIGACVDAVAGESPTNNQCSAGVQITVPSPPPDLITIDPAVSDTNLSPGQSYTVKATVQNQGGSTAASTTLRYYESTDSTISTADTEIATDAVISLIAGATFGESADVNAPATPGTYWIGACVDAVAGESPTNNQCSTGVQITVSAVSSAEDKIGVYRPAQRKFILDFDGNRAWSPGVDIIHVFGAVGDTPIIGDWDGDGDDDIGTYRPAERKFILDMDDNGSWSPGVDVVEVFGAVGDLPIIGDWNGDGDDDIGTYRPAQRKFILDIDESGSWSPGVDIVDVYGAVGDSPIIGDWNGDGDDDIGVYRPAQRKFILDFDENRSWSPGVDIIHVFGAVGDTPIIGDWNGDGDDDIGTYRPSQRKFILDIDESGSWSPGVDIVDVYGTTGDQPLVGKW